MFYFYLFSFFVLIILLIIFPPEMANKGKSRIFKIQSLIDLFPNDFILKQMKLKCKTCEREIKGLKQSHLKRHLRSEIHLKNISTSDEINKARSIGNILAKEVTEAFLDADIPLKKLRNLKIQKLFKLMGFTAPSETKCRGLVEKINEEKFIEAKDALNNKDIFLMLDGTSKGYLHYINILGGTLDEPDKQIFLHQIVNEENETGDKIKEAVFETLDLLNVNQDRLKLVLTDAAPYNIKAKTLLKEAVPDLIFITCFSHFLHNCANYIRKAYPNVDKLIASFKDLRARTNRYEEVFNNMGIPPNVIITRWNSWLKCAEYYATHFAHLKDYIISLPVDPKNNKLNTIKEIFNIETLQEDLNSIVNNYGCIIDAVFITEKYDFSIIDAFNLYNSLSFKIDPINLNNYCINKWKSNEISVLMEKSENIGNQTDLNRLKNCPSTTVSVERSFSMLNKLLAKDRNFKPENIKKNFRCYFKSK